MIGFRHDVTADGVNARQHKCRSSPNRPATILALILARTFKALQTFLKISAMLFDKGRVQSSGTTKKRRQLLFVVLFAVLIAGLNRSENDVRVQIVIVTHDALEFAKLGLETLKLNTVWKSVRLTLVDSGSGNSAINWFRKFCAPTFCDMLIAGDIGYTRAANIGVRSSNSELIVLMNPDVLVCPKWLEGMLEALLSCPNHAAVGPLTNAGSFQSIPNVFDQNGELSVNPLPSGISWTDMCNLVKNHTRREFPIATFLNGFLMLFRRDAFEQVGGFDEVLFPIGYGEENDFSLKLQKAGHSLAIADNTYAQHFKTVGFSAPERKSLAAQGSLRNKIKYGLEDYKLNLEYMRSGIPFLSTRSAVAHELKQLAGSPTDKVFLNFDKRVVFILPVRGSGGGVISILQLAIALKNLGIECSVAIKREHADYYVSKFEHEIFIAYNDIIELEDALRQGTRFVVLISTIHSSIATVLQLHKTLPDSVPMLFAQDYEVLFYPERSKNALAAMNDYATAKSHNVTCFAKTKWVQEQLMLNHGISCSQVSPTLDHVAFHRRRCYNATDNSNVIRLLAMVRVKTPRRSPLVTLRTLTKLKQIFDTKIETTIFGSSRVELLSLNASLEWIDRDFGIVSNDDVAQLMGTTDIFLDLSSYQAFGRGVVECMATMCVPVVPAEGGAVEFVEHGISGFIANVSNFEQTVDVVSHAIRLSQEERRVIAKRATLQVSKFTSEKAAMDLIEILQVSAYSTSGFPNF